MTYAPRPLQELYNQVKNMRQYIKPEISVDALEEYSLMAASVKTEDVTTPGGSGVVGPGQGGDNEGAGSKDGFPWSDDFDFHMD